MTQQYLRACSLLIGNAAGQALDLSALRVEFHTIHANYQTPKALVVRIYNVSRQTASTAQNEFTRIILSAGYQGNTGKLFDGEIRQFRFGRESATNTFLEITAAEDDQIYTQGFVSQVLNQGWTAPDVARELASAANNATQDLAAAGLKVSVPPPVLGAGARPKVMFGPIRSHCRTLAASTGTSWSITDGQLSFTPLNRTQAQAPQTAIVLSPSAGLIGIPVQTVGGIEATCLLNPQIAAGTCVHIDAANINAAAIDPNQLSISNGNLDGSGSHQSIAGISPSGTYVVDYVEHTGDTRGNPWYTNIAGHAADVNSVISSDRLLAVP